MHPEIHAAFDEAGGLLRRRDHPRLARRLDHLLATGAISSPLPGILALGELLTPEARIAAGLLWAGPDAVATGLAAARLTFWPEAPVPVVELARDARGLRRPGWTVAERRIDPESVVVAWGLRCTTPALTAIDLAAGPVGGDGIDRVLRTRTGTLVQLRQALAASPGRRGNQRRAELLLDSRDEPWSAAERALHRLLRSAGLAGWRCNAPVGRYVVDVLFDRERVVIEVDGFEVHGGRGAFEADRARRNELELAGFLVLNVTWAQLHQQPEWVVACVRRALALRSR